VDAGTSKVSWLTGQPNLDAFVVRLLRWFLQVDRIPMLNAIANLRTPVVFIPMLLALLSSTVPSAVELQAAEGPLQLSNDIWEAGLDDFSVDQYDRAVEAVLAAFEQSTGRMLVPGNKGKAGLKVYSESGPGISTPRKLVRAVLVALQRRGFGREQLFIAGLNDGRLRSAGFLPPLSIGGNTFFGIPVYALDSGKYYDPLWFYDSPLPSTINSLLTDDEPAREASDYERKSFLAVPLLLDVDFWINLPSYTDHPVLGINGALVNATLWNASNTMRFFRSPASAPAAVAEIAAIPELQGGWVFSLVSLERFQFIGGPIFNSLYTLSEPRLWLSQNPVILDAIMRERIDAGRRDWGFRPLPSELRLLAYCEQIGLGSSDTVLARWRKVDAGDGTQ
jgi:hypothetical protein